MAEKMENEHVVQGVCSVGCVPALPIVPVLDVYTHTPIYRGTTTLPFKQSM